MGRVGSCFDNAAAEAFFSSLELARATTAGLSDVHTPDDGHAVAALFSRSRSCDQGWSTTGRARPGRPGTPGSRSPPQLPGRFPPAHLRKPRAEAKSPDSALTCAYITRRRLRHGAQRGRLVGGRTAESL